jgi:hypothetical protein
MKDEFAAFCASENIAYYKKLIAESERDCPSSGVRG